MDPTIESVKARMAETSDAIKQKHMEHEEACKNVFRLAAESLTSSSLRDRDRANSMRQDENDIAIKLEADIKILEEVQDAQTELYLELIEHNPSALGPSNSAYIHELSEYECMLYEGCESKIFQAYEV